MKVNQAQIRTLKNRELDELDTKERNKPEQKTQSNSLYEQQ
jgi:hypothetical protein